MLNTPHIDYPFRRTASGSVAQVEQDSLNEIANAALAVLKTPIGFRVELPEFGIPDPPFQEGGPDLTEIRTALNAWEPRANYALDATDIDNLVQQITVNISGRADA